ncbi:Hsp33 family molecular chaperone HslO [Geomonas oryzisoli]|uniref:33 kDa chaperonin n=1 Tax=Geomonas oryzisoli TaxID=2847992 RepID=A0ABX8J3Q0_9BACT|nr:Hsp33 family molecular chaperone HslO [Geomonas oryzisoli]
MDDYLVRILTKAGTFRGLACVSTGVVAEAARRHGTLPTATAALGRALTGGALMGALLKTDQRVALKFEGNGPLGKILIEALSTGAVAGTVGNPAVDLPLLDGRPDVAGALGRTGLLTVTKDLRLKQPYQGTVRLTSSEIGEDLAMYLTESEQVPSAVRLDVFVEQDGTVGAAGGFLIQSLPPQDETAIHLLWERIGNLSSLSDHFCRGGTPEQLLDVLFVGIPFETFEKRVISFQCTCSREKCEQALLTQGKDALRAMADREGGGTVTCAFCREVRNFSQEEMGSLVDALSEPVAPPPAPSDESGKTAVLDIRRTLEINKNT